MNDSASSEAVGYRIRELRRERGIQRQQVLADAADVDVMTVSRLERGLNDPTLSTLRKLARALGVSVEELVKEGE